MTFLLVIYWLGVGGLFCQLMGDVDEGIVAGFFFYALVSLLWPLLVVVGCMLIAVSSYTRTRMRS